MFPIFACLPVPLRGIRGLSILVLVAGLFCVPFSSARAGDPDFLHFGAGWFDISGRDGAVMGAIDYQASQRILSILQPAAGLAATGDGAFLVHAGVAMDLFFDRRWVLTPGFAPALYVRGGGKDLGQSLQFRSSLRFAYRLDNRARIGVEINHLSNAGLSRRNPGANQLMLIWSMPLSR